jgi:hypothetical protein
MLMYERRIESSLFKTVAELQRLQIMRKLDEGEDSAGCCQGGLRGQGRGQSTEAGQSAGGACRESVAAEAVASEETPHGATTNEVCETKPNVGDEPACSVPVRAYKQTPRRVTTNGQGALAGATMQEPPTPETGPSCETKPICGTQGDDDGQCLSCTAGPDEAKGPVGHQA